MDLVSQARRQWTGNSDRGSQCIVVGMYAVCLKKVNFGRAAEVNLPKHCLPGYTLRFRPTLRGYSFQPSGTQEALNFGKEPTSSLQETGKNLSVKESSAISMRRTRDCPTSILAGFSRNGLNSWISSVFQYQEFVRLSPTEGMYQRCYNLWSSGFQSGQLTGILSLRVSWTRVNSAFH